MIHRDYCPLLAAHPKIPLPAHRRAAIFALAAPCLPACRTMHNHATLKTEEAIRNGTAKEVEPGVHAFEPGDEGKLRPFGGVEYNLLFARQVIKTTPDDTGRHVAMAAIVAWGGALSAVADTLMLPVTYVASQQFGESPRVTRNSDQKPVSDPSR